MPPAGLSDPFWIVSPDRLKPAAPPEPRTSKTRESSLPSTAIRSAPGPVIVVELLLFLFGVSGPWARVIVPVRPDRKVMVSLVPLTFASLIASRSVQPFGSAVHAPGEGSGAPSFRVLTSKAAA